MTIYHHSFDSTLGRIYSAATDRGVCRIDLPHVDSEDFISSLQRAYPGAEFRTGGTLNLRLQEEISEYLDRNRREFTVPLDLRATDFATSVLHEVASIPYGATRTYGEIARALNKPGGARAVGGANAHNPLPLVIPCHRVVASNGLGGYGGGLDLKRRLLAIEGATDYQ